MAVTEVRAPALPGRRFVSRLVAPFLFGLIVPLVLRYAFSGDLVPSGGCGGPLPACPDVGAVTTERVLAGAGVAALLSLWTVFLRPRWFALLSVGALVAGVLASGAVADWFVGGFLQVHWAASPATVDPHRADGGWRDGPLVAEIQDNRVTGRDAESGRIRWTYSLPARQSVCQLSDTVAAHTGLVAIGSGSTCGTLVAVDLTTGRTRWSVATPFDATLTASGTTTVPGPQGNAQAVLAMFDGVAAVVTGHQVLGYDLTTGVRRWRAAAPGGCQTGGVVATLGRFVAVDNCGASGYRLTALDPSTGRPAWSRPLPDRTPDVQVSVVSTDPLVVAENGSATDTISRYDGEGDMVSTFQVGEVTTPNGPRALQLGAVQATPVDVATTNVFVGMTVTALNGEDNTRFLVGFNPVNGTVLWTAGLPDAPAGLALDGARLLVVDKDSPEPSLTQVSLTDGAQHTIGVLPDRVFGQSIELLPGKGNVALVNTSAAGGTVSAALASA
jgi:outer membrane protein assembly factor BamB